MKALLQHPAAQAALARTIAAYLRFVIRTTRWRFEGREHVAHARARVVVAFWHEALPLLPKLFADARRQIPGLRVVVLASRHKDGQLLGGIMRALGMDVVHGSSSRDGRSRGGSASVRELLDVLEADHVAALTPDGPRGPARTAAAGVAQLAGLSGAPIIPVGAMLAHSKRLRTWDRLIFPLPFGRGALVCGPPVHVPREGWEAALPDIASAITAAQTRAEQVAADPAAR